MNTLEDFKGASEEVIRKISEEKREPQWMLNLRLEALKLFFSLEFPSFGPDLSKIDFSSLIYYSSKSKNKVRSWDDVPEDIKLMFEKLGVPEAERKFFAGLEAMIDSKAFYEGIKEELIKKGVIFTDTDTALKEYEDLFKTYFGSVVKPDDNKFSALNTAFWSGGTFIYVPKGVKIEFPLHAYFRMETPSFGQFERTIIICEEKSSLSYLEGCTAPLYQTYSLHAGVVECIVKEGASLTYTTIQNWSKNVYNLVTKRAFAYKDAKVTWIDGNIGSLVTMKYPSVYLKGENSKAIFYSLSYATKNQIQDVGAKIVHEAPNTSSLINSKSITKDFASSVFRGFIKIKEGAYNSLSNIYCDSLTLGREAKVSSYPHIEKEEKNSEIYHEAKIGRISEDNLFYLRSRGLKEDEAISSIVIGFAQDFIKELPLEYAVELYRFLSGDNL